MNTHPLKNNLLILLGYSALFFFIVRFVLVDRDLAWNLLWTQFGVLVVHIAALLTIGAVRLTSTNMKDSGRFFLFSAFVIAILGYVLHGINVLLFMNGRL
jgi:hypothetical protein